MSVIVYSRWRRVVNTDPQRRCYNGCNFSERIDLGEWEKFGEYESAEQAELVMKGLRCPRYDYKAEQAQPK